MDKQVQEFCHKYEAQCGPTGRPWRRVKRIPYSLYRESDPSIFQTVEYTETATIRIEMPEDRFRALLDHAEWVQKAGLHDNMHFSNNVMRVSNLIVEHEEECRVRRENPAVKIAYEKYRMLLELSR